MLTPTESPAYVPPTIVTVHGINSDGGWQDSIETSLRPFFKCVAIRYPQYRRFGFTKLFSDPYLLIVFVPLILVLYWLQKIGLLEALLSFLLTLAIGYLIATWRRGRALETVREQLSKTQLAGACPDAIAHSLGSYLLCTVMRRWEEIRFRRIILSGCVVSKSFDWEGHLGKNPYAFVSVRNELAGRDRIARAAAFIQGLMPGLGHAGFVGFKGSAAFIHDSASPNVECAQCQINKGKIHNIKHADLGHNDAFVASERAETLWLPTLWGIEPVEYQRFLRLCSELREAETDGVPDDHIFARLRDSNWSWTGGVALHAYLDNRIRAILQKGQVNVSEQRMGELVMGALNRLWRDVEGAMQARIRGNKEMGVLAPLYPRWALARAIDTTVKATREWKRRSSYR